MRVALVCPHFPPEACGVGDYTSALADELTRGGDAVRVWTAQGAAVAAGSVDVTVREGSWGRAAFAAIAGEVAAWRPDGIAVQFTPNLYGRRGLNAAVPGFLRALRASGAPVLLNAHELHYPIGLTPDRLLLGTPQLAQFFAVAASADGLAFTYEVPRRRYSALLPWKRGRIAWLPVGANVAPPAGYAPAPEAGALLQFGSPHPSRLFDFSLAALDAIRAKHGPAAARLLMAGTTPEAVARELAKAGRADLRDAVTGLGYLSPADVSRAMARAQLVLAPFYDGASTRRGSVMAALAHARPVVTTDGYHTDRGGEGWRWSDAVALAPARDRAAYATEALRLFEDRAAAEALARAGADVHARHFAWSRIAEGVRTVLHGLRAR